MQPIRSAALMLLATSLSLETQWAIASRPLTTTTLALKLDQRATTEVAAPSGLYWIQLDDITDSQVRIILNDPQHRPVLGPTSIRPGDRLSFTTPHGAATLDLLRFHTRLLTTDSAELLFSFPPHRSELTSPALVLSAGIPITTSPATAPTPATQTHQQSALSDSEIIERLIDGLKSPAGLKFVRNEATHSPSDAQAFLRHKLRRAQPAIGSVMQFIDQNASKSSTTGQEYMVLFPDGRRIPAREYWTNELRRLQAEQ